MLQHETQSNGKIKSLAQKKCISEKRSNIQKNQTQKPAWAERRQAKILAQTILQGEEGKKTTKNTKYANTKNCKAKRSFEAKNGWAENSG